jgi:hypothetical protein
MKACSRLSLEQVPDGVLIKMVFHDNLWHIPMFRPLSVVSPCTVLSSLCPAVKVNNYYRGLDATSRDKRVAKTITDNITVIHTEGHRGPQESSALPTAKSTLKSVLRRTVEEII